MFAGYIALSAELHGNKEWEKNLTIEKWKALISISQILCGERWG